MKNPLPIVENMPCADAFADSLARIENIGPCVRLVFAVSQLAGYSDPDPERRPSAERVIVAKVVIPTEARAAIAHALLTDSTVTLPVYSGPERDGAALN